MKLISLLKKRITYFILLFLLTSTSGCINESSGDKFKYDNLIEDHKTWWTYYKKNIDLRTDFRPLDVGNKKITRKEFIKKLSYENFIPFIIDSVKSTPVYKLFKINPNVSNVNKSILNTSKMESREVLHYLNLERKPFPTFSFTNLKNKKYSNKSIKNKTVILKTWFIGCKACIAEFPSLNKLVEKHKDDKNLLFISLALDSPEELKKYLKEKAFYYEVIPDQREFITNTLKLKRFPTHLIVENGIIKKVGSINTVFAFFEKNKSSESKNSKNIPPPPPPM